jgi:hypothetical protein
MKSSQLSLIIPNEIKGDLSTEITHNFSDIITYSPQTLSHGAELLKVISSCKTKHAIIVKPGIIPNITEENCRKLLAPIISGATSISYSDYTEIKESEQTKYPLIDCQIGAIRDDFDFGPLWAINIEHAKKILPEIKRLGEYKVAGWYSLRLRLGQTKLPVRVPEFLYSVKAPEKKLGYEEQFSYVDAKNRSSQIEFEDAFTEYSKEAGFYLPERTALFSSDSSKFPVKASVFIPVRDREKTVGDAVKSALAQKTNFSFNVIVVNNHSSDGTAKILNDIAAKDSKLVHIQPEEKDLLIGGCWNKGANSPQCGEYIVQLDSDDLYISDQVLQKVIDKFHEEKSAAVIGSYNLVNFDLQDIPPGLIDHKEWTPNNGHNNALRIHGLGAPRAIATTLAREIKFENVSYGEDYAMMLAVCRNYKISRIYESLYLCRRWDGNSDANLPIEKKNKNNIYKDLIRSREVLARMEMNNGANK